MYAWIMYARDYSNWVYTSTIHFGFRTIIPLPLFELNPNEYLGLIKENELILVVDGYEHPRPYTLEQVEEINKIWNKFYD